MFCQLYSFAAVFFIVNFYQSCSVRVKYREQAIDQMKAPEGHLPICSKEIVKETCGLLHGGFKKDEVHEAMQFLRVDSIKEILSAHQDTIVALWKALGVPPMPTNEALQVFSQEMRDKLREYGLTVLEHDGENVLGMACEEVCYFVRDYVKKHYVLPPASDLQCQVRNGEVVCDIDVRPESLASLHRSGDMPNLHEDDVTQSEPASFDTESELPENTSIAKEPRDYSVIDYAIGEIVQSVAELFRFYPMIDSSMEPQQSNSMLQLSTNVSYDHDQAVALGKKAIAFVNKVLRQIELPAGKTHIKEWFGVSDSATKTEIARVLNSVKHVLKNVHYEYPGPKCGKSTYAYVYPRGLKCSRSLGTTDNVLPCRLNHAEKFIYYLCDVFVNGDDGAKIETLVHEGSHHAVAYTDDVCADRGHIYGVTPRDECVAKAYGRSNCATLATHDRGRALKNADNLCYFVQAVADPDYHAAQRCKRKSNSVTPFADEEGDCKCTDHAFCFNGRTQGCPSSAGLSNSWFLATCENCKCLYGGGSRRSTCPTFAASSSPDAEGDCACPEGKICSDSGGRSCPMSSGSSPKFFSASCSTCTCKAEARLPPSTPTSEGTKCPTNHGAAGSIADNDGDCMCKSGTVCLKDGIEHNCPYSGGLSSTYFKPSCTSCKCSTGGSGPPPALPGKCPNFASTSDPDSKGDCRCPVGKSCHEGNLLQCMASGNAWSHSLFRSTCTTCECKVPQRSPNAPNPLDDEENEYKDSASAWPLSMLAIFMSLSSFSLAAGC